jgi:hypothetical protein
MNGIELARRFFVEAGLPLLRRHFPGLAERVAAGLIAGGFESGCGSEVGGFDDAISQDHNWGPRFFLFLGEADQHNRGHDIQRLLDTELPDTFAGFRLSATTLPKHKAYVVTPAENLRAVLGLDRPPDSDQEWIHLPEIRLFEYTAGMIFYEPVPLISPLRERFAYYPNDVWYKRLSFAFFELHAAGNALRMARRGDAVACRFYVTSLLRNVMRVCFLLRRRYAPYHKWLFRALQRLPDIPGDLIRRIERLSVGLDLEALEENLYGILDTVGGLANKGGLIEPQSLRRKSAFTWTDFNCYGFMEAFHRQLRGPLREKSPYEGPLDLAIPLDVVLESRVLRAAWEK